jgi:hypothetical protein
MITGFGMYPEAWLRMQAQEIEQGLAARESSATATSSRRL